MLDVQGPDLPGPTPLQTTVDLYAALHPFSASSIPDPETVRVVPAAAPDRPAACRLSPDLRATGRGQLIWLSRSAAERRFYLYFSAYPAGQAHLRRVLSSHVGLGEPVGLGDEFLYGRPRGTDPIGVGMTNDQQTAVDWDGDGRIDLLQRNIYAHSYGEPYWGVFLWRNLGSNIHPRLAAAVRLRAGGVPLAEPYASWQALDWDHDGRPDLIAGAGRTLTVYRQTGGRDGSGLPLLERSATIPVLGGGSLNYGMRLLDWTGGRGLADLFTLRSQVQYFPTPEVNYTWYRHPQLARTGEPLRFGPGEPLHLAGSATYAERPNDFADWDGDGDLDLLGSTDDLQSNPPHPGVVVWENTGSRDTPRFGHPARRVPGLETARGDVPTFFPHGPWAGLLIGEGGNSLRRWEWHAAPGGTHVRDQGQIRAPGQPCSSGGYNCAEVVDWDGDGDLDFICGNESGFVSLIENISRSGRTQFRTARGLKAGGHPLRVTRWQFLNDQDPEWNLGQSKPCAADWDLDGDLDLLIGNNANRIAYCENLGNRVRPRLAAPRTLVSRSGPYFSFRKRPVVVDWDGDGLPDLVAGDQGPLNRNDSADQTICLYRRYRDDAGRLQLHAGIPFLEEQNQVIRLPIPYVHGFEAADWDDDGDFDLFTNEAQQLYLYRNIGSNAAPRFRRELLRAYGTPIHVGHHETSVKVVDWDRDGRADLVCGGESGWLYYFRRAVLDLREAPRVVTK